MMSRTFCPLWPRRPGCPGPPGCPGEPCRENQQSQNRRSFQHSEASVRVGQMKRTWRWRTDLRSREAVYSSQSRIAFFSLASLQRQHGLDQDRAPHTRPSLTALCRHLDSFITHIDFLCFYILFGFFFGFLLFGSTVDRLFWNFAFFPCKLGGNNPHCL